MISARFFYVGETITGCTVSGHAGYAEAGEDVVCAYVSAVVQTVANLMTECFQLPILVEEQEENAAVQIRLTAPDDSGNAQRLFAGLKLQLSAVEISMPQHIQVQHMEV